MKSFTLIEVIIATSILSVVMLSLFKVNDNAIFLIEKSKNSKLEQSTLNIAIDTNGYSNRNENIYLDKYFNISDDEIRRELKQVKINVKDTIEGQLEYKTDFMTLIIEKYKTKYILNDSMSKNIYRFALEL